MCSIKIDAAFSLLPEVHTSEHPDEVAAWIERVAGLPTGPDDREIALKRAGRVLQAQADAGGFLLDEEGFQYRLTQDELDKLVLET